MPLQRTLALIKPDVVDKADAIVEMAQQAGFTVLEVRGTLQPLSFTCDPCMFGLLPRVCLRCLFAISYELLFDWLYRFLWQ